MERSWFAVALAVEHDAIRPVTEAVEGGGAEELIREGGLPLAEVKVARNEGARPLIALGDELVEIFVLG